MAPAVAAPTRCLYEVLGVSRDCSAEEIRAAYKKQALRLHPDKVAQSSGGADTDATAAFQELQHAYDVLRDPRERSWYDSHRSQILFASAADVNPGYSADGGLFSTFFSKFASSGGRTAGRFSRNSLDDLGNLYAFFSPSAFSGFADTGRGFYKVYGDLFGKIYSNEVRFAREVGVGLDVEGDLGPAPLIGNLESPAEQWTAFYNYWLGFSTVIDFSWADEYDARGGINRRERREMEELNRKARKRMRREYNDTIRSLAAFVKKRDKRVVELMKKKKAEELEKKEEQRKKKEEEKKRKEEKARTYMEAEWAQMDEEEEEVLCDGWFGKESGEKKSAKTREELYCVVCSKKFKSDKQWKNHEQSKKHRDKVAELRQSLQAEDENLDDVDDDCYNGKEDIDVSFDYVQEQSNDSSSSVADGLCDEFEDGLRFQEQAFEDVATEAIEEDLASEDELTILEAMVSRRNSKNTVNLERADSSRSEEVPHHDIEEDSTEYDTRKSCHRARSPRKGNTSKPSADDIQMKSKNENTADSAVKGHEDNLEQSGLHFPDEGSSTIGGGRNVANNPKPKKHQFNAKIAANKDTDVVTRVSSKGKKQKLGEEPA